MSSDHIHIRDLGIDCIIGIMPNERIQKQQVLLNIDLECDLSEPCRSDDISDTLDYKALKMGILELVRKSEYFLIEKLAQSVADYCLRSEFVKAVTISLDKPGALTLARSVAVEIRRER